MVVDPEPEAPRNTWRTYLCCLEVAAELGGPSAIVQDDCLFVTGFTEAADQIRAALPHAILAFCVQGMIHHNTRSAFWRAMENGQRLLQYRPHNWVPAMALGWTPELARLALYWDGTQTGLRANYHSDDGRLFHFCRTTGVEVWCPVPCLVDHPDDVPSVKENSGGKRGRARSTLAVFEGDARDVAWAV